MSAQHIEELPLIALLGPTAVGKTAVGIALAKRLKGEIISADAVAVYRGLDIGSAKPTLVERDGVPFHLIDVANPDEDFTVAAFSTLAKSAITGIRQRGRVPIIVGGTGLYVRSVTVTLSVPEVPPQPDIREQLWEQDRRFGIGYLHAQLKRVDPIAAEKILPGDAKRIIRALEVFLITGRPMSSFHTPEGIRGIPRPDTFLFGLRMERARLYERIERRVDAMVSSGLSEEVCGLLESGYGPELKSMQSLGYRHMVAYLRQEKDFESAIAELKQDTRRYAKRQMIWFNADPNIKWLEVDETVLLPGREGIDRLAETIVEALAEGTTQQKI